MFGKNLTPSELVAPAFKIIEGSTADVDTAAFKLKETGASFLTSIREGDLVVKDPTGTPSSSLIREVESNTEAETHENLDLASAAYDVIRPNAITFRPGEGVEQTVHTIIARDVDDVHPVIVFMTDGMRYVEVARSGTSGLILTGQNLKCSYKKWLEIRSYNLRSIPIEIQGINKTVQEVGV